MAHFVVTVTKAYEIGPASWFCSDEEAAEMSDADLLSLVQEAGDVLDDAAWTVERVA